MKMFFLLKNNARRGDGRKRSAQKGRGKGGRKRERKKECSKRARKRPPKFANSKTDGWLGGNSQILKAGELCLKTSGLSPDALIMSINRNNREWSLKIHIFYFHNPSCRCNAPARCSPLESRHGAEDCKPKSGRILSV